VISVFIWNLEFISLAFMLKVGLTGGIGSGKSTAAQLFEVLGIPVYYADIEAKRLMNENEDLKQGIINLLGKEAYKEGELNRPYVASVVFNNAPKLDRLNALVHPATKKDGEAWMNRQTTPYAIHEAALLFEAGVQERLDLIIGVKAPEALRIKRAMERDKVSKEEIEKRMSRQMKEDDKISRCHFVLTNDEEQLLIPQVLKLHEELIKRSKQKTDE
jgi:dephospho-CoA kinase